MSAIEVFQRQFKRLPDAEGFTPGRVNLIGEHIDYNGGLVLPTGLPLGVSIAASLTEDRVVRIASDAFPDVATRPVTDKATGHWSDYVLGAVKVSDIQSGADIALCTSLPFGAGISSSAAVCVGTLARLFEAAQQGWDPVDLAKMARRVETDFIGMPCGIMDQMAVALAMPGHALALDTDSLAFDYVPLPDTHDFAVIHSGVHRRLNEGRYAERKIECDQIKAKAGRDDICRLSDHEVEALGTLPDPLGKRLRHVVSEHHRVMMAVEVLRDNQHDRLGQLMIKSHASMRDDFEITVPAIDTLVADAVAFGASGARMTGGGFGGAIVALIERTRREAWQKRLHRAHPNSFAIC